VRGDACLREVDQWTEEIFAQRSIRGPYREIQLSLRPSGQGRAQARSG
jgi:hypothetical protein